jgi:aspartate/methionine/tyrosine aminotransferase
VKRGNAVLAGYGTTVFEVMSGLAREHRAINLGQGFPDDEGPADVRAAAAAAIEEHSNQYPPMMGLPELRRAVADHDNRFYDLGVDWASEVMVTSGATEALADSLLGLLDRGDEAVVFEPVYDSYVPMIRRAGATAVPVRLRPPDWTLDPAALAAAFSDRTKLVVLNSPLNPAGKVFDRGELEAIAAEVAARDCFVVCDEVYEHLVFDGREHIPLMTLPGMRERCVRIASAGKTFSLTGWKIGYITAAAELMAPIARAHQFVTFTTAPPLQRAVAHGLGKPDGYFHELAASMQARRDRLAGGLAEIGFEVARSDGTYFLNAGFRGLGFAEGDVDFCRRLITEAGVAAIPVSAFYLDGAVDDVVRLCFAKREATLDEALARLRRFVAGSDRRGGG